MAVGRRSLTRGRFLGLGTAGLGSLFLDSRLLAQNPSESAPEAATLVAAGDIASDNLGSHRTAKLIEGMPGTVLPLGDNAYESGTAEEYDRYYEPGWGRFKDRSRPAIGNHDYGQGGWEDRDPSLYDPSAYFDYFGEDAAGERGKGWYSYDLGASWHVVALNSMYPLLVGDEQQSRWLLEDLGANTRPNLLAYWHHPVFSSGFHGSDERMRWAFQMLYEHGCSVVLSGHDHTYERFAPQDADGNADEGGIRQFVVGTEGRELRSSSPPSGFLPNSEMAFSDSLGVLKLTLYERGYGWRFVPVDGESGSRDVGSALVAGGLSSSSRV